MPLQKFGETVIVVDASVVAPALADIRGDGSRFRDRLRGQPLSAPDLMRTEVLSVLRRRVAGGALKIAEAETALRSLTSLPALVYPTAPLLNRAWELRNNLTPYEACYVALAEALGCPLLTADSRLARSPGIGCAVEVI